MAGNGLYAGRTALVTGASAGIGTAFARALAARGAGLVLTARREERLAALAAELEATGVPVTCLPADLSDPAAPQELAAALERRGLDIDILINNAGYGLTGVYTDRSWEEHRAFLEVMAVAPCRLARALLPGMKARGWGRIVNVSSVAGLVPPSAGHTLYGASKAFLVSFSQSLAAEGAGHGVKVSALCPGFTLTEFHDVNATRDLLNDAMPRFMIMSPEKVASDGLAALERGRAVCVPGWQYKAIVALARALPMGWAEAMAKRQSRRYRKT